MARFLLLVHGGNFKPAADALNALWLDAIRWGLLRDAHAALDRFDRIEVGFAYYGDSTNRLLRAAGREHDEQLDIADCSNALSELKQLDEPRRFRRARYEKLPGKTAFKELLADAGAPLSRALGLSERVAACVAPELAAYWQADHAFKAEVIERITRPLCAALQRNDDIMVLSHGLGSVATYDVFWQLSRGPDADSRAAKAKVNTWVTLGSPLGDEAVKKRLNGADRRGALCYPGNVLNWYNVSAEDDYLTHDKTLANDYSAMLGYRLVSRIRDFRIYNLAVRYGRSDPHCALGYLIHPRVTRLIADWLCADELTRDRSA
ncbi:MAG: hypothetical protein H0W33_07560 [Gammaproteobacteria bacterium]|nr:hypothetical protein [Gammaproteobacteria bacterium]